MSVIDSKWFESAMYRIKCFKPKIISKTINLWRMWTLNETTAKWYLIILTFNIFESRRRPYYQNKRRPIQLCYEWMNAALQHAALHCKQRSKITNWQQTWSIINGRVSVSCIVNYMRLRREENMVICFLEWFSWLMLMVTWQIE